MSTFVETVKSKIASLLDVKSLDTDSWPADLLLPATSSGVAVNATTALSVPAVANAVALISGAIATLPFTIYALDGAAKTPAADHPGFDIVADAANEWTSSAELRRQLAQDAMLYGDAYAYVNRVNSEVVELIRLIPGSVTILYDIGSGEPSFRVNPTAGQSITSDSFQVVGATAGVEGSRTFSWRDIIHIRAPLSLNGVSGVSPIQAAREAIGLSLTLEQHAARLFGNGARPSGILKFPIRLDGATTQRIKASWNAAHNGSHSGGTAVLEQGGDFQQLTLTSVDAQFHEMRAFQIVEIARAFNVNPSLIGDLSRATWSNSEEANRQFLQYTLLPWLRTFESSYRRVILSPEERKHYSIEFDVNDLLRGDTAARGEFIAKMRASGVMTANEARAIENLPARSDGDSLASPHVQSPAASKDKQTQ